MKFVLKNSRTGEDFPEYFTTLEVVKTQTHLSFSFDCKNSMFYSAGNEYNSDIYTGDVCEAFICVGEDLSWYYEIEVAPNNCQFLFKMHNVSETLENIKLEQYPISKDDNFLVSEVVRYDNNYKVNFSVPLDKIGYDPNIGILFNAYRIETEGGYTDRHLLAVNPTLCETFHAPHKFIKLDD